MKQELTVKTALQPPPTKTEVINALVQLAFEKWSASKKKILEEKKLIEGRLKSVAFRLAKKMPFQPSDMRIYTYGSAPHVEVSFNAMSDEMRSDMETLKELENSDTNWDENTERIAIRNAMNGVKEGRVQALLDNEETRKKLINLGSEIGVL